MELCGGLDESGPHTLSCLNASSPGVVLFGKDWEVWPVTGITADRMPPLSPEAYILIFR